MSTPPTTKTWNNKSIFTFSSFLTKWNTTFDTIQFFITYSIMSCYGHFPYTNIMIVFENILGSIYICCYTHVCQHQMWWRGSSHDWLCLALNVILKLYSGLTRGKHWCPPQPHLHLQIPTYLYFFGSKRILMVTMKFGTKFINEKGTWLSWWRWISKGTNTCVMSLGWAVVTHDS